jgi:multiple sugar transport system substrate-binding protein
MVVGALANLFNPSKLKFSTRLLSKFLCTVVPIVLLSVGCSSQATPTPNQEDQATSSQEPVTIRMYLHKSFLSDTEFQTLMADPVKKKYPNITLEMVKPGKDGLEDDVSKGDFPDTVFSTTLQIGSLNDLKVVQDLSEDIKSKKFDINQINPVTMQGIHSFGEKNQVLALPFNKNVGVMYFNKDIFDKMGAPYPKDGMTWQQVIELAKRISQPADGIQYKSLEPVNVLWPASELSLPSVDPGTYKTLFEADGWKRIFQLFKQISDIPGNNTGKGQIAGFLQDKTIGMWNDFSDKLGQFDEAKKQGDTLNWDMASYPSLQELPGVSMQEISSVLLVTSTSKHKTEAFDVISYLSSKEVQMISSKTGRISALKDAGVKEVFGKDLEVLKGKNIQALFNTTPAPLPKITKYDIFVRPFIQSALKKVLNENLDINTALKQANEEANAAIAAQESGK